MLLFNFAWQPRQSFWEEDLKTSYVIVQLLINIFKHTFKTNLKTSYVIVQRKRNPWCKSGSGI